MVGSLAQEAHGDMAELDFAKAFPKIQQIVHLGNANLSQNEFWLLVKSTEVADTILLQDLLYLTFEISRVSSNLLEAYCPDLTQEIMALLGQNDKSLTIHCSKTYEIDTTKKVFVAKVESDTAPSEA